MLVKLGGLVYSNCEVSKMSADKILSGVFAEFDRCAKRFCKETNGMYCDISSQYKGTEKPQNLKYRFAKIYYNSFVIRFTYTRHGAMSVVNSSLSCGVFFDKDEEAVELPLPLLTDYCDRSFAVPMYLPFITNAKGMIQGFGCLERVLGEMMGQIEEISYDPGRKEAVLQAYFDEIYSILQVKYSSAMAQPLADFFSQRFTSAPYINFLNGNREKAAKQLGKVKKLMGYERRMLRLWQSAEALDISDISALRTISQTYNSAGVPKANGKEFAAFFLSWLAMTPAATAVYLGLYYLLVLVEGRNSVYLMGPDYNSYICVLFGFITAIAASYFVRFQAYKLLFKKDYERYCQVDCVQNGVGADKLMKRFLILVIALSVAGCVLFVKYNLNFQADGFVDNRKFFSLKGEYYSYDQVERVYYKPDRVNGLGETLENPSYVLVLRDGTEIDFYEYCEISDYEEELLAHFRGKGVSVDAPDGD